MLEVESSIDTFFSYKIGVAKQLIETIPAHLTNATFWQQLRQESFKFNIFYLPPNLINYKQYMLSADICLIIECDSELEYYKHSLEEMLEAYIAPSTFKVDTLESYIHDCLAKKEELIEYIKNEKKLLASSIDRIQSQRTRAKSF